MTGIADPVTAGASSDVTVTALDQLGNVMTGYTGTIAFASTDGSATLPANYTFTAVAGGIHVFTAGVTLVTVGEQGVTATDVAVSAITGSQTAITVEPRNAVVSIPAGSSVPGCEMTNECFLPASVTIDVGGTVTWSNDDSAAHTVTSGTPAMGPDGTFDSGLFGSSTAFAYLATSAGTFDYFCQVHPWQVGSVVVE